MTRACRALLALAVGPLEVLRGRGRGAGSLAFGPAAAVEALLAAVLTVADLRSGPALGAVLAVETRPIGTPAVLAVVLPAVWPILTIVVGLRLRAGIEVLALAVRLERSPAEPKLPPSSSPSSSNGRW